MLLISVDTSRPELSLFVTTLKSPCLYGWRAKVGGCPERRATRSCVLSSRLAWRHSSSNHALEDGDDSWYLVINYTCDRVIVELIQCVTVQTLPTSIIT